MLSLQKRGEVFIWRSREYNLFLTQLIRIPSIGIPMYLIKFTVIYEESTKAQVPGEHSIKELPPFRVLALLARQEISPTQILNSPTLSLSSMEPPSSLGRGTQLLYFFHFSLLCIQDSYLPTSIRLSVQFKNRSKATTSTVP